MIVQTSTDLQNWVSLAAAGGTGGRSDWSTVVMRTAA
mgnify:CR=1 FL=1